MVRRKNAILTGAVGALILMSTVVGGAPAQAAPTWTVPACGQVTGGSGALTFTWSDGHYLTRTATELRPVTVVSDIEALAAPNTLLAVDDFGKLSQSRDAGCSWTPIATLAGQPPYAITAAGGASAYVWSRANDELLYRVDGTKVTELPRIPSADVGNLLALAVDGKHLRAVTSTGVVLDSVDGGLSFQRRGVTPQPVLGWWIWGYEGSIGRNLDHIVLGTSSDGVYTTFDGGLTWTSSRLSAEPNHRINIFSVAVSPADENVVWAEGLDTTELDAGNTRAQGRHLWRSTDGGRTFTVAVDHDPATVTLTNGVPLAPHPTDPDVVYFEYGTWFANYGTDLYAYDAGTGRLSTGHSGQDGINAITFNPAFPQV
ncbi:MAG: dispase autolysis-inducing protein, partial [Hamadaea sp.]|nr:dispase autolysis-inducing protein [Hamadaea sp.]